MHIMKRALICAAAAVTTIGLTAFGDESVSSAEPVVFASVENPSTGPWWGNGRVSFRNYIRFERVKI